MGASSSDWANRLSGQEGDKGSFHRRLMESGNLWVHGDSEASGAAPHKQAGQGHTAHQRYHPALSASGSHCHLHCLQLSSPTTRWAAINWVWFYSSQIQTVKKLVSRWKLSFIRSLLNRKKGDIPHFAMLFHRNKGLSQKSPWRQATTSLRSHLGDGTKVSGNPETTCTAEFSNQLTLKYIRSCFL